MKITKIFCVTSKGDVKDHQVIESINPDLDAEALKVVGSLPRFEKPAKKDGKIVRVYYMVPITFALH